MTTRSFIWTAVTWQSWPAFCRLLRAQRPLLVPNACSVAMSLLVAGLRAHGSI